MDYARAGGDGDGDALTQDRDRRRRAEAETGTKTGTETLSQGSGEMGTVACYHSDPHAFSAPTRDIMSSPNKVLLSLYLHHSTSTPVFGRCCFVIGFKGRAATLFPLQRRL